MVRPVRYHARYTCDIPVEIHSPAHKAKLADGRILNISMGGIGIALQTTLQKGIAYEFWFALEGQKLKAGGRVAWEKPRDPDQPQIHCYGISFNMSVKQEGILKVMVDQLRMLQSPIGDDRMKNYWNV